MNNSNSFLVKYKNLLISLLLLITTMFVILQVILPQITEVQKKNEEIENEKKRIETLKTTLSVLASIDNDELEKYFQLTQKGLPQVKDVLAVYNELASAAQKMR